MSRDAPITELRSLLRKRIAILYDDPSVSFEEIRFRLEHMIDLIDVVAATKKLERP